MYEPTATWVENGVRYQLRNCPIRFIPPSVWEFARLLRYHQDFPSAPMPAIGDVSARWLAMYYKYSSEYADSAKEVRRG